MFKHLALCLCLIPTLAAAQTTVGGDWLLTQEIYGNSLHQRLTLKVDGTVLSGTVGRQSIEGVVTGNAIRFVLRSGDATDEFTGTLSANGMTGTLIRTNKAAQNPFKTSWSAQRVPARRAGPPQHHEFVPTTFHRQFSASTPPALRLWPGDTVHTTTVDAGGTDEKGVTRVLGGNPQTGPFYVETALPGDVLDPRAPESRLGHQW